MILACQDDAAARRVPSPKWVLSWENMVMGQNFVTAEHDQLFLLPPDAREWLPGRHLAWAVLEAAGELEMAPFTTWYRADGQGRPAYHPRLMVGLVMYCYCKGIRSSRAIEMATWDDLGARVICGNLHPDHATVARFVTHHEQAVKGLLVQSLVACAAQGLVSVDVVAGDGTKVKASASMAANATAAQLEVEIGELEALLAAEVEAWFAQAQAAEDAEDALFGDGDGDGGPEGGGGTMTLARLTDKIVRRQKAKAKLDAEEQARRAQAEAARLEKIARLERRVARHQAAAAREEAVAAARVAGYQARAAAKAAAGSRKRPDGRVPVPPDRHVVVRRKRAAAAKAQQALAQAKAAPPAARPTRPAVSCPPRKAGSISCTTYRPWPAGTRSSTPSAPTATPPTAAPCTPCSKQAAPTWTPLASATRSARHCLTPGTPAKTTSPPHVSPSCTSPSPRKPARLGGCAMATNPPR